jgi:hypothetical protein
LIPGGGAIYNGEFVKAAIHVLIFGTLVSIHAAIIVGRPLLGMINAAFYFYRPFEAYYTAKRRMLKAEGVYLETPIEQSISPQVSLRQDVASDFDRHRSLQGDWIFQS